MAAPDRGAPAQDAPDASGAEAAASRPAAPTGGAQVNRPVGARRRQAVELRPPLDLGAKAEELTRPLSRGAGLPPASGGIRAWLGAPVASELEGWRQVEVELELRAGAVLLHAAGRVEWGDPATMVKLERAGVAGELEVLLPPGRAGRLDFVLRPEDDRIAVAGRLAVLRLLLRGDAEPGEDLLLTFAPVSWLDPVAGEVEMQEIQARPREAAPGAGR
jgi:hypothetical protein